MTTTNTPHLDFEFFSGDFDGDINANFNEAFFDGEGFAYNAASETPTEPSVEVTEPPLAQDGDVVSSEKHIPDEFQHLDFAALQAYQPGDDLQEVAGEEISSLAPPPKTPPQHVQKKRPQTTPRKRKSSNVVDLDISPTKRSNPGPIEAMWSPGMNPNARRAIPQAIPPPPPTYSSSPAANNITTLTPARKPAPKKARTPAAKRTPAVKKTTQQPQRPQKAQKQHQRAVSNPALATAPSAGAPKFLTPQAPRNKQRTVAQLYVAQWGTLDQQEKARLLLPMLQGIDPLTGKKFAKAGSMAQEIQGSVAEASIPTDPYAEIAKHILSMQSNPELAHDDETAASSDSEQGIDADQSAEDVTGWQSPTEEQATGWRSPTQDSTYNDDIDRDRDFAYFAEQEVAADARVTQSPSPEFDQQADSPPCAEATFAPQTPEAQIMTSIESSNSNATPFDQITPFMDNSNNSTPIDQTPSFGDFLNNGGTDNIFTSVGSTDLFNKAGNGDLFNGVGNFDMFNFNNNNIDFSGSVHTGLTPIESSFGAYEHTGLTPTDTSFGISGQDGLAPTDDSFFDTTVHTGLTPTAGSFDYSANTGLSSTSCFDTGVDFNNFDLGLDVYQNAGITRQREALMNHERRVAEGRRR